MSTLTITAMPYVRVRTQPLPLRLTRRGRLVLTGVTLLLLVVGAVLASGGLPARAGTDTGPGAHASQVVTVAPGETLWAIAEREAPGVDPREIIARIVDLNALESAAVQAGDVLLVPAR